MRSRLLRTAPMFFMCFVPAVVFAIAVHFWPARPEATAVSHQASTVFERMYRYGKQRMGVPDAPPIGESGAGATAIDKGPLQQLSAPRGEPLAAPQRAREVSSEIIKQIWGVEFVPGACDEPARLTEEQKTRFEQSVRAAMPSVKSVNDSLATCSLQHAALQQTGPGSVAAVVASIAAHGARPYRVIDEPKQPAKPGEVDPATHNPWSLDRIKREPVERVVTLPDATAQEYVKELRTLWRQVSAADAQSSPQALPSLDVQLSHALADKVTLCDLMELEKATAHLPETQGFVIATRTRVVRLVHLIIELGYKNDLADERFYPNRLTEDEQAMLAAVEGKGPKEPAVAPAASAEPGPKGGGSLMAARRRRLQRDEQAEAVRVQEVAGAEPGVATKSQLDGLGRQVQAIADSKDRTSAARLVWDLLPDTTRLKAAVSESADRVLRGQLDSYFEQMQRPPSAELADLFKHPLQQPHAVASALSFTDLVRAFPNRPIGSVLRRDAPMATVRFTSRTQPELGETVFYVFFWDGTRWNYLDLELIPWSSLNRP